MSFVGEREKKKNNREEGGEEGKKKDLKITVRSLLSPFWDLLRIMDWTRAADTMTTAIGLRRRRRRELNTSFFPPSPSSFCSDLLLLAG